jgi:hypothetical protein
MSWEVEFTDEFGQWWEGLTEDEQDSIDVTVRLLEELGPHLPFPHFVRTSKGLGIVRCEN